MDSVWFEAPRRKPPDRIAIVVLDKGAPTQAGRRLTYAKLAAIIRATANRLHAVSGNNRPVVSILTPLLAESFIASWAGAAAGIANPINPLSKRTARRLGHDGIAGRAHHQSQHHCTADAPRTSSSAVPTTSIRL
jgi:acyl-CoA synthetase (AMP-forming)/AMP-acid ligase II